MSAEWIYKFIINTRFLRVAILKKKFRHLPGQHLVEVHTPFGRPPMFVDCWRVRRLFKPTADKSNEGAKNG